MIADTTIATRITPNRNMVKMNWVLSFMPSPLPDYVYRFGLYRTQTIEIQVVQEIGDLLFTRKVVLYHPPRFVFQGHDEPLVKRDRELVFRPDCIDIGIIILQPLLDNSFCFIRVTCHVVFRLNERPQEPDNHFLVT